MTQKNEEEWVRVDPRLARALERRGARGYTNLLLELSGTQELDDHTKKGLFWQLIGWLAAEAGRATARPWQFLSFALMVALFISVAWIWNFMFLMALGLFP